MKTNLYNSNFAINNDLRFSTDCFTAFAMTWCSLTAQQVSDTDAQRTLTEAAAHNS